MAGREVVAAAWIPGVELADGDGLIPDELVWAALDCPGGWAVRELGTSTDASVTAALAATLLRPVVAGEEYVSYAWVGESAGRKHPSGVALATAEGELCAVAEALWVDPRQ
ncbi:hypothetical protein [Streptomyces sp. NPDC057302]|uniref:hypothetical protein n=1 Tax=Streptomyces sp. NPDC057302 TaxID=3346094 RepID=UPI003637DC6E